MPLSTLQEDTDLLSLSQAPGLKFLVCYSSVVDGKLWCPVRVHKTNQMTAGTEYNQKDCVRVEQLVNDTFLSSALDAVIIYVGDRHEWVVFASLPMADLKIAVGGRHLRMCTVKSHGRCRLSRPSFGCET